MTPPPHTVTVTVTHPSATDVAMVGRVIGDVALRASVTMARGAAAARTPGPAGTLARMELRARHDVVGTLPVVALSGSVDLATVPQLAHALFRLVGDHPAGPWRSTSTASTSSTTPGWACCSARRGGRVRPAASSWSWSRDERLRDRFAATGFDRAVDVVDRLAAVPS